MANETLELDLMGDVGYWGYDLNYLKYQLKGFEGDVVKLPMNSFGGSVLDASGIYNFLLNFDAKIEVHIASYAMSSGTLICCAADEVHMPENGFFVIHNPYTEHAEGQAEDLETRAKVLREMRAQFASAYKKRTGLEEGILLDMMAKETWLTAKEAKEMGFITHIAEGVNISASIKPADLEKYKNAPSNLIGGINNNKNTEMENDNKMTQLGQSLLTAVNAMLGTNYGAKEAVDAVTDLKINELVNNSVAKYFENNPIESYDDTAIKASLAKTQEAVVKMPEIVKNAVGSLGETQVAATDKFSATFEAINNLLASHKADIDSKLEGIANEVNAKKLTATGEVPATPATPAIADNKETPREEGVPVIKFDKSWLSGTPAKSIK